MLTSEKEGTGNLTSSLADASAMKDNDITTATLMT
jgi:hypothetical protein